MRARRPWPGDPGGAAFATLEWNASLLMLQTVASLAEDVPQFEPDRAPVASGTVCFRGLHPDSVRGRVSPADIVKGAERSWYSMTELYLRDPDGYVICIGAPDGTAEG